MGNMAIATIFIVSLNVLMWMSQVAMLDLNPDGPTMFNLNGSIIDETVKGQGDGTVLKNDFKDDLPSSAGTIEGGDSSGFTDIFNNILGWFKDKTGIKYVYGVVSAPYNILKSLGLPAEFSVAIGTLWYLVSFFILVSFLWGRD